MSVENLLEAYMNGKITELWVCDAILSEINPVDVDKAMAVFPKECIRRLKAYVEKNHPEEDGISIGNARPIPKENVVALRRWFVGHSI